MCINKMKGGGGDRLQISLLIRNLIFWSYTRKDWKEEVMSFFLTSSTSHKNGVDENQSEIRHWDISKELLTYIIYKKEKS